MRKFMINVNGKSYEVEVEELGGAPIAPVAQTPAPAAAPAPAPAPAAKPVAPAPAPAAKPVAPAPAGNAGSIKVVSPMPGTILRINASVGDTVTKGQPIVVLEAMKMENDIVAPEDGTISSINVSVNQSVNNGEVLVTLA